MDDGAVRAALAVAARLGCPCGLAVRTGAWLAAWPGPPPHVTYGADFGEVCLEWWAPARKLTVWLDAREETYVRYAGDGDIEDGDAAGRQAALAAWLAGEQGGA